MNSKANDILKNTLLRYPALQNEEDNIVKAYETIILTYRQGGKLLICGNGGSAADADHIVGELMKGFLHNRPVDRELKATLSNAGMDQISIDCLQRGLPAINLSAHTSLLTATINDLNGDMVFAQQVIGYGKPGDLLFGISTSGNSRNVLFAVEVAKAIGLRTIALTGITGGKMAEVFDLAIRVPEKETFKIQELHLPVYHALCAMIEEEFFGEC